LVALAAADTAARHVLNALGIDETRVRALVEWAVSSEQRNIHDEQSGQG
jgi:hypothetical protein